MFHDCDGRPHWGLDIVRRSRPKARPTGHFGHRRIGCRKTHSSLQSRFFKQFQIDESHDLGQEDGGTAYTLARAGLLIVAWRTTMKPIPTTGGDREVGTTVPVEKDAETTEQDQAADYENLPMDVYIDSKTRHAHFRYKPELANRRKSRQMIWKICS